jgi:uncharacterized protein YkwD
LNRDVFGKRAYFLRTRPGVGLAFRWAHVSQRIHRLLNRVIEDGEVTRDEARSVRDRVREGGVTTQERGLVRRTLNLHERDVFEPASARVPLRKVAGAPGRPLFGRPEVVRRFESAVRDGQMSRSEAVKILDEIGQSTATKSSRRQLARFLRDEGHRIAPAARRELQRELGIKPSDPATPPADRLFDPEELSFFHRLNAYRAELGLSPVSPSLVLTRASEAHSQDMTTGGFFSHTGSDGSDLVTRVGRQTDLSRNLGEILALNISGGEDAFEAWKRSPGHDAIMRHPAFTQVGIARVADASGNYRWTADFGGPPQA